MDNWLFALQLGLVSAVVVLIAGWTVSYVLRSARAGAPPVIRASFKELQKSWYQVQIAVANRAPYEVIVDELGASGRGASACSPRSSRSAR
jgi:hypothetical protein